MQSIEALETIMTPEVTLLYALSTDTTIEINQESHTISLTHNYNKDDIITLLQSIQTSIDNYKKAEMDNIAYIKDFIKWLELVKESIQNFNETL
tara:strand:- start:428 stop:709 length:282 start_codon:yes stop_codon:yes gene_type:complete